MKGQGLSFRLLPHRPPFLFVDRILALEPGREIVAVKRVSAGEEKMGPGSPPGGDFPVSLIAETMAQVASLAAASARKEEGPSSGFFVSIKKMQISREPKVGEELWLRMRLLHQYGRFFEFGGEARIGEELVGEGELVFHQD
ncbi:MAG: hypothetical protein QHH30_04730 [candidate division NC10 bacterium]|nr:hypothetical protein [candidate division NC10 bacterium]